MNDLVVVNQGRVLADSREIAERFGKLHKHVLRKIDQLLADAPDLRPSFGPRVYEVATTAAGHTQEHRRFDIDRDGFVLLVMGFTGPEALRWKVAYIAAFNAMEAKLRAPLPVAADPVALVQTAIQLGGEAAGRKVWKSLGLPQLPRRKTVPKLFTAVQAEQVEREARYEEWRLAVARVREVAPVLKDFSWASLCRAARIDLLMPDYQREMIENELRHAGFTWSSIRGQRLYYRS